ncbi:MAG: DUF4038 domain-containing protein, partial [Chitinivibrionales bacterium]|nr:DUF4038 domain-containing protein [Chitinivibrionales bacterium]
MAKPESMKQLKRLSTCAAWAMVLGVLLALNTQAVFSGPCGISANHRYFLDGSGQPCFWQGDTDWDLFSDYTVVKADSLLEYRRVQGFNAFQIMIFGVNGVPQSNYYNQTPFVNSDPTKPNETYFKLIDSIVDLAGRKELTLVIGVYHWFPQYASYINTTNAQAWAEWVGARYKDKPNIIWAMYPQANDSYTAIARLVAAGLQQGDSGKHLITVHPDPPASSSNWQSEAWLSFNSVQTNADAYSAVRSDYVKTPVKPVVIAECQYESGSWATACRQAGYGTSMAGGFYTYGNVSCYTAQRQFQTWMTSPGAAQMKVMGGIFRSVSWWKLITDSSVISGASQNKAARSSDGDWLLVYL